MDASRHRGEFFTDKFPRLAVISLWLIGLAVFAVILDAAHERGKQRDMQEYIKATSSSLAQYQRSLANKNEQELKNATELVDKLAKGNLP